MACQDPHPQVTFGFDNVNRGQVTSTVDISRQDAEQQFPDAFAVEWMSRLFDDREDPNCDVGGGVSFKVLNFQNHVILSADFYSDGAHWCPQQKMWFYH